MEVPQTVIQTVDRHVPKIEIQEIEPRTDKKTPTAMG